MYQEPPVTSPPRLARTMRPEPGDVVIRRICGPPVAYGVGTVPGPPQVLHGSYDEALAHARGFAAEACVDVWAIEDGEEPTLVARRRR